MLGTQVALRPCDAAVEAGHRVCDLVLGGRERRERRTNRRDDLIDSLAAPPGPEIAHRLRCEAAAQGIQSLWSSAVA